MPFFILFILAPLLEMVVFGAVGARIGFSSAILLTILSAVWGGLILRGQGMQNFMSAQSAMRSGRTPLDDLFDGVCASVAGILLIIPGFVTDAIALLLLFPPARAAIKAYLGRRADWTATHYTTAQYYDSRQNSSGQHNTNSLPVLDAEFEDIDEEKRRK